MSKVRACGALTGKTTKFHKTGFARFMKFCCFPCESAAGRSFQKGKTIFPPAAGVFEKRSSSPPCAGKRFREEKIIQNLPQAGFE